MQAKLVLTVRHPSDNKARTEVYALNPGDSFPAFGGSRHALIARKTASIVLRQAFSGMTSDIEYDIHDPKVWAWLGMLINSKSGASVAEPSQATE